MASICNSIITKRLLLSFPVLSAFAISLIAAAPLNAAVISINENVPATMNTGGTSSSPAEYIIGAVTDPPTTPTTVIHTGVTAVGSTTAWNKLTVQNGWKLTTTGNAQVGYNGAAASNNQVVVSGSGSAWTVQGTRFYFGSGTNNSVLVTNGGTFSLAGASAQMQIGVANNTSGNSFTISNGSSVSQGTGAGIYLGYNTGASGNSFVVKNGASYTLSGGSFQIAYSSNTGQNNNHLDVSGANTRVTLGVGSNATILAIGKAGVSGNYALVEDGALLQLSDATVTRFTIAANNYLRLDNGFFAIKGDQTTKLNGMIAAGNLQTWDGTSWAIETDLSAFKVEYFSTLQAADALAFTGYSDLGGYTVITNAIPEPGAAGLLLVSAGVFAFMRRRM